MHDNTEQVNIEVAVADAMKAAEQLRQEQMTGDAWSTAQAGQPVEVHDLNGSPLFYDVPLEADAAPVGMVRMAATTAVGSPVVMIEPQPRQWDPGSAGRAAIESAAALYPHAPVRRTRLVCYAYPKIGVEVELGGPDPTTLLFDAVGGFRVETETQDIQHDMASFSFLDRHPVSEQERRASFEHITAGARPAARANTSTLPDTSYVWLSPVCEAVLGVSHYGQVTPYNCVPASAQMVLDRYGFNFAQNSIAQEAGTSSATGTSDVGIAQAVATLTGAALTVSFDALGEARPSLLADAVTEIAANRPVFTQLAGHFRVCLGYARLQTATAAAPTLLYIFDPWPWNADPCEGGVTYWEAWPSSPILYFGFVRHGQT